MIDVPVRPDGATRLVIVRHTEPDESVRGTIYGATDIGLSDAGARHAIRLGAALAQLHLTAVYCSPRARTRQTADALGMAVVPCAALREIDFGELEGRTYDDVRVALPEVYAAWMSRPTEVRFPGGESFTELRERAVTFAREMRIRHPGRSTALVTHGGVSRALIAEALGMADEHIFRLDQRYGAVNVVDYFDDVPVVRLVNAGV